MAYPANRWAVEETISYTVDLSGAPAIVAGADDSVYFAQIVKGNNLTTGATHVYDVVVGKISILGVLQWMLRSPALVTPVDESEVAIALGPANEIIVAFVTLGAVLGRRNMDSVPSFCPETCQSTGPHDIVIARIDQNPDGLSAAVTWVIQDASINSCNMETRPVLSVDKANGVFYIAYECSNVIQCFDSPGRPNIVLSCFNFSSTQYWTSMYEINSTGHNTKPAIVAFNGVVYVALECDNTIPGGRPHSSSQVDVIKLRTIFNADGSFNRYTKEWVLSNTLDIFAADGSCSDPSLAIDTDGNPTLAMLTTDIVLYGSHSTDEGLNDLVLVSFTPAGELRWMKQGGDLNLPAYEFRDCYTPVISNDIFGVLYVSLVTYFYNGYEQNVIVYKINSATSEFSWYYKVDFETYYNCYTLARTGGPNAMFPSGTGTSSPYSRATIAVYQTYLYLALGTRIPVRGQRKINSNRDSCIVVYNDVRYYDNVDPYKYMSQVKKICRCKTSACGC